jgi:hypothetical protein
LGDHSGWGCRDRDLLYQRQRHHDLELGVQTFGSINAIVDGGTLPACTSVMEASVPAVSATGGATATRTVSSETSRPTVVSGSPTG